MPRLDCLHTVCLDVATVSSKHNRSTETSFISFGTQLHYNVEKALFTQALRFSAQVRNVEIQFGDMT
jgi:hypothetical protein